MVSLRVGHRETTYARENEYTNEWSEDILEWVVPVTLQLRFRNGKWHCLSSRIPFEEIFRDGKTVMACRD